MIPIARFSDGDGNETEICRLGLEWLFSVFVNYVYLCPLAILDITERFFFKQNPTCTVSLLCLARNEEFVEHSFFVRKLVLSFGGFLVCVLLQWQIFLLLWVILRLGETAYAQEFNIVEQESEPDTRRKSQLRSTDLHKRRAFRAVVSFTWYPVRDSNQIFNASNKESKDVFTHVSAIRPNSYAEETFVWPRNEIVQNNFRTPQEAKFEKKTSTSTICCFLFHGLVSQSRKMSVKLCM